MVIKNMSQCLVFFLNSCLHVCIRHAPFGLKYHFLFFFFNSRVFSPITQVYKSKHCFGFRGTVNSLSYWRKQFEVIWVLQLGALFCWRYTSEDGPTVLIKGWTWSSTLLSSTSLHNKQPELLMLMLFTPHSEPTTRISQQKSTLCFLFLSDTSGLLLLLPVYFMVQSVVHSEMLFCKPWL